jgi:hypothetical protein
MKRATLTQTIKALLWGAMHDPWYKFRDIFTCPFHFDFFYREGYSLIEKKLIVSWRIPKVPPDYLFEITFDFLED